MKHVRLTNSVKTTMIIAVALAAFVISTTTHAQQKPAPVFTKNSIASIIDGIHSEAEGTRKACILLAGRYNLSETLNDLISQLKDEENPKIKALIAVSLLNIGDLKGIKAVYHESLFEQDEYASHMYKAVILEYNKKVSESYTMK